MYYQYVLILILKVEIYSSLTFKKCFWSQFYFFFYFWIYFKVSLVLGLINFLKHEFFLSQKLPFENEPKIDSEDRLIMNYEKESLLNYGQDQIHYP